MTNHWIDVRNSDCILIMGANPAENHPISFRWVMKAKERGAKIVVVDPRFTKSAAHADIYARLRPGTDIAFLGGMIKYILDHDLMHRDYVAAYTNASFLIKEGYEFDPKTGVFSGYDAQKQAYDQATWGYEFQEISPAAAPGAAKAAAPGAAKAAAPAAAKPAGPAGALPPAVALGPTREPKQDPTLTHPRCVFQLLKKHFERYDVAKVAEVTGTPGKDLEAVYAAFGATGAPEKAGAMMYAMGWTQHTVGAQNIRAASIIQLLLGNMGRAGGGINAMRGESNVQGSTDHGLLYHVLPGYLKVPSAAQTNLAAYLAANTPATIGRQSINWWGNTPKYVVSLLKSMYGEHATAANEFGYGWLPKLEDGANYSWLNLFDAMHQGAIKGFFAWGMNPACSGANSNKTRQALAKLDWLVNVNIYPNETGSFWEDPSLGIRPEDVRTEVFVLPAASSVEKEGSISNSGRWMQWRYKAQEPLGDAKPDADIMNLIFRELRALYQAEGGALPDPILKLKWDDYFKHNEADAHALAKEINGYFVEDVTIDGKVYKKGTLVPGFPMLRADGSTSSGCWIYCNSYTEEGNRSARRKREASGIGLNLEWAWAWPMNRRIIYNRASVDLQGRPWNPKLPTVAWMDGKWVGDVIDGGGPPPGVSAEAGRYPFIMKPEGRAALFGAGLKDGPFPEHYEPLETPVTKNPFNPLMVNPMARPFASPFDKASAAGSADFPIVCSTYRVTEHWQTGVMTRNAPWLLEAVPQIFLEMSEELARELGVKQGDEVRVASARGALTAVALPTKRLRPMTVHGHTVHQVGLPWCFGWRTPVDGSGGDSANLLTPAIGDPNSSIPESKAFLVRVQKLDAVAHPELSLNRGRRA
jgi:formate dehydrogenase major subunit